MKRVLSAAAVCLFLAMPARADVIDSYAFGVWEAFAFTRDDGSFWYCGLDTEWNDGRYLSLRFGADEFTVVVSAPGWNFTPGANLGNVSFLFDNGQSAVGVAEPAAAEYPGAVIDTAFVDMVTDSYAFVQSFMNRNSVTVVYPNGDRWQVSLSGTYRTLQATANCMDLYSGFSGGGGGGGGGGFGGGGK